MQLGKFGASTLLAAAVVSLSATLAPVTVRQGHLRHVHVLWARVTVRHALTGLVVQRRDRRPRRVPFDTYTSRGRSTIPANAPLGDYRVTLRLGSRRGGAHYGVSTRTLRVLPLGLCRA